MFDKYHIVTSLHSDAPDLDNGYEIRAKFKAISEGLHAALPALPQYFDLAYILGQSQGVAPLSDNTLSVQDYLRNKFRNMSQDSIQLYILPHTTQVTKLPLGELNEDQLSTKLPSSSDTQGARDLQTFIAIKFCRVTDESKMWLAKQQYPRGPWS